MEGRAQRVPPAWRNRSRHTRKRHLAHRAPAGRGRPGRLGGGGRRFRTLCERERDDSRDRTAQHPLGKLEPGRRGPRGARGDPRRPRLQRPTRPSRPIRRAPRRCRLPPRFRGGRVHDARPRHRRRHRQEPVPLRRRVPRRSLDASGGRRALLAARHVRFRGLRQAGGRRGHRVPFARADPARKPRLSLPRVRVRRDRLVARAGRRPRLPGCPDDRRDRERPRFRLRRRGAFRVLLRRRRRGAPRQRRTRTEDFAHVAFATALPTQASVLQAGSIAFASDEFERAGPGERPGGSSPPSPPRRTSGSSGF